ncbi:MAG: spore coat protein U domain-containing protein [Vulcanimicrobiaceae bacterium]
MSLHYSHHLTGGAGTALQYDLYATPDRSSVWGNGGDGTTITRSFAGGTTITRSFAGGTPTTVYLYGRIPPRQKTAPGRLDDSLLITTQP